MKKITAEEFFTLDYGPSSFMFPLASLWFFVMLVFTAGQYIYTGSIEPAQPHYERWWEMLGCFCALSVFIRFVELRMDK